MASTSIFISATDARQNPIRETIIHDEARGIESAILDAVRNGLFQATVSSGTPLTSGGSVNLAVAGLDLNNDQLYIPGHPFKTGDLVTVSSNEVLPAPLSSTGFYAVIYIDQNHIKLAASTSAASDLRPIAIDFTVGVTEIDMVDQGAGYLSVPRVSLDPSTSGDNATASAVLAAWGSIDKIGVINPGSGFTDVPSVSIQAQGSGAAAGTVSFKTVSVSVAVSGSNYRIGDVLSVVGGTGAATTATVTEINGGGGVIAVALGNPGNYSSMPGLSSVGTSVLPGGGSGCLLNLVMGISQIAVDAGGANYVAPPVIEISGGNGTGASATAVVNAGKVVAFQVTAAGSGYTNAPTVTIESGSGADAYAVLNPTSIQSLQLLEPGTNYLVAPTVTIVPVGSGASVASVSMLITGATLSNSGGGYNVGDTLLIAGGSGTANASIQVTRVGGLGEILAYTLATSGSYTALPDLNANPVTGGSGRSASFNLTAGLEGMTLADGGMGYTTPPTVVITSSNGRGQGAKAVAVLDGDSVVSIKITNSGSGYTAAPDVYVTSGEGAEAVATIVDGSITRIDVVNGGKNYTCIPTVLVNGGGNIAAAALTPTGIDRIEVTDGGSNWVSSPQVFLEAGPAQSGLFISPNTAVTIGYSIERIIVTAAGSGYGSAPAVHIAPPNGVNGFQAAATAQIGAGAGTFVVSLYPIGRDYWKVWKNLEPSSALYTRPYAERMDTVIAYFTNLGYTINRQTNPATGNTIQWQVMW